MTMTEQIWSEEYVRDNPKLAAEAIATLQMLLQSREDTLIDALESITALMDALASIIDMGNTIKKLTDWNK